jgi:hypothetical protein
VILSKAILFCALVKNINIVATSLSQPKLKSF